MNTNLSQNKNLFRSFLTSIVLLFLFDINVSSQCNGVKMDGVKLSVVQRPCGQTSTGSLLLEIKGGLAPYTLSWTKNETAEASLPTSCTTKQLEVENLSSAMQPGYVVSVKDACANSVSSAPLSLVNSVPIQFVNAPIIAQQFTRKDEPNGKLLVELRGGNPPRSLVATDSKGKSFVQQFPVGPAEKGIFKYELNNLPAENYKIELKSGSEKCTQVWKETIEFKAPEK
jgi:hypothetical protein